MSLTKITNNNSLITENDVEKFCIHVANGMPKKQAAAQLGHHAMWASRTLKRPEVQARIQCLQKTIDPASYWRSRAVPEGPAILSEIMKVYENAVKDDIRLKALELLGRYRCLFTDKVENTIVASRIEVMDENGGTLTVLSGDKSKAASEAA